MAVKCLFWGNELETCFTHKFFFLFDHPFQILKVEMWHTLHTAIMTHLFFFNFYFFISWRLVTLQYCSGFYHDTFKTCQHIV